MQPRPEPVGPEALPPDAPGWLTASVSGLLSAGVFLVPGLLVLLAPVPLLIAWRRHGAGLGLRASLVGAVGAPVLATVVAGATPAGGQGLAGLGGLMVLPAYGLCAVAPAALLAWALGKTRDARRGLELGTVCFLGLTTVLVVAAGMGIEGGVTELVRMLVQDSIASAIEVYREEASSSEAARRSLEALERRGLALWMVRLFPSVLASLVIVGLWLNVVYSRWFVGGERREDDLTAWRLPMGVMYGFMACAAGAVLQAGPVGSLLPRVDLVLSTAANGLVLLATLYWLQGVAVLNYWFLRLKLSPILRMVGLGAQAILMVTPTSVFFGVLGLADAWFDLRRLDQTEPPTGEKR